MSHKLFKGMFWGGLCAEDWWIDHMENELDPSLMKDMDQLLKNSPGDRKRLDRLWRTKKLIKESDDVVLPEDGRYYDNLHDKIMQAIETKSSQELDGQDDDSSEDTEADQATNDSAGYMGMSWTLALLAIARRWDPRELVRSS